MRFELGGAFGYPAHQLPDRRDGRVFIDPVSEGPNEELCLRFYIDDVMVCVVGVGELEQAIAYAKEE